MIDKVREFIKRDLWSLNVREMQKEIIDSRNIILALVEVVDKVRAFEQATMDSTHLPCSLCDYGFGECGCREANDAFQKAHNSLIDTLATADERIGEILGESDE